MGRGPGGCAGPGRKGAAMTGGTIEKRMHWSKVTYLGVGGMPNLSRERRWLDALLTQLILVGRAAATYTAPVNVIPCCCCCPFSWIWQDTRSRVCWMRLSKRLPIETRHGAGGGHAPGPPFRRSPAKPPLLGPGPALLLATRGPSSPSPMAAAAVPYPRSAAGGTPMQKPCNGSDESSRIGWRCRHTL